MSKVKFSEADFGVVYMDYDKEDIKKEFPIFLIKLEYRCYPNEAVDISNGNIYSFDDDDLIHEIGKPAIRTISNEDIDFIETDEGRPIVDDTLKIVLFNCIK
jgi:hypothetical protein